MPENELFDNYFSDDTYFLHIKTKHIQFSINIKNITEIKGNTDKFTLFCKKQVYHFDKRKISIIPTK